MSERGVNSVVNNSARWIPILHQLHTAYVYPYCSVKLVCFYTYMQVVGTIDCWHVRIQPPGGDYGEIFRKIKGYFSFNVQAVCDANIIFQDMVARWPGSSPDSLVFNNSRLKYRLDNGHSANFTWMVGTRFPVTCWHLCLNR